jgi:hypothetical protein
MTFPEFNENGDLPVGIYKATLQEILEHFGQGSLQRQVVAKRLAKIYELAKSTGKLSRFIIYGSFITAKKNPNDVDIFLVMRNDFRKNDYQGDVRRIFENLQAENKLKASIFWMLEMSVAVNEKVFICGWQSKRGGGERGIVEVIVND